jgi:hypothetical protein
MSIENGYNSFPLSNSNTPPSFSVKNSYNLSISVPNNGTNNIALWAENLSVGYKGVQPPTNGCCIQGNVAIGKKNADYALDVEGGIKANSLLLASETLSASEDPIFLSSTKDSILDSNAGSLVTIIDDGQIDQTKIVRLYSKTCAPCSVITGRGSFNLNYSQPCRKLRYAIDGWLVDDLAENNSFYISHQNVVVESSEVNAATSYFGMNCALSSDGLTLVVGADKDDNNKGAAFVFVRRAGGIGWTFQQKLVGTENLGSSRQGAVAISADGNTIAVGGYAISDGKGATWVFKRSGTAWTQVGTKLIGSNGTSEDNQGTSVALSSDGNTLAVGAPGNEDEVGAVWIFTYSQGSYTESAGPIVGTSATGTSKQGTSIALSSDGKTLAFGGTGNDENLGATWVFKHNGSSYVEESDGPLIGTGATGASRQGASLALSADGNTLAVGGYVDNNNLGATWIFYRTGITWAQQGSKLVGTDNIGPGDQGKSVALSSDGNSLLVLGNAEGGYTGAIWRFLRVNNIWTQQGNKIRPLTMNMNAGGAVAMSTDGRTVVVTGTNLDNNSGKLFGFR